MARLSNFRCDGLVVRDGVFASLGHTGVTSPECLSFADTVSFLRKAEDNPCVSCLITTPALAPLARRVPGLLLSENPQASFYLIHQKFLREGMYQRPFEGGRGEGCRIHPTAALAPGCRVGDRVVVGEFAVIRDPVWIGSDVLIEAGVKLGVEGILYFHLPEGLLMMPHAGYVRIHDHAALMTDSVVVRSVHDSEATEVGRSAIIGLGSIVGHDAHVGDEVVVSNHCVLARRCRLGSAAFIGTGAFVREHVEVGKGAQVKAGSVVVTDVAPGECVSGNFATDHSQRTLEFARMQRAAVHPREIG